MPKMHKTSTSYSTAECLANIHLGESHILALFGQATDDDIRQGTRWYQDAYNDALKISNEYNVPIEVVADVAAALSPKMEWTANMPAAEYAILYYQNGGLVPDYNLYKSGQAYISHNAKTDRNKPALSEQVPSTPYGGLKANFLKALWVLQGHDVLSGPKVEPFADNILHYDTSLDVTADSHIIQVWMGKLDKGTYRVPPKFITIIKQAIITVAKILGIPALVLQAILWIIWLRLSKKAGRKSSRK